MADNENHLDRLKKKKGSLKSGRLASISHTEEKDSEMLVKELGRTVAQSPALPSKGIKSSHSVVAGRTPDDQFESGKSKREIRQNYLKNVAARNMVQTLGITENAVHMFKESKIRQHNGSNEQFILQ